MIVLGIETSCDETAAAVISDDRVILSNLVLSQLDEHRAFGGVVPEVAARAHLDHLDTLIKGAMSDAGIGFKDLSGVAATCGPGLIGGVMVGMMAGKAIAAAHKLPFIAINHLEAHALTPRLTDDLEFPYLLLLVSGGHSQILVAEDVGIYRHWGGTMDDALGECFDKSAKLMGLPYPGGPNLEKAAQGCIDRARALTRFDLPRPMKGRPELDFSFSGLKTAVRAHVDKLPEGSLKREDVADLSYSFQEAICDILQDRLGRALTKFKATYANTLPPPACGRGDTGGRAASSQEPSPSRKREGENKPTLVLAGGVAANLRIRTALTALAEREGFRFVAPPVKLCGDNAAMIAWAGIEHLRLGHTNELNVAARPRWPLTEMERPEQPNS